MTTSDDESKPPQHVASAHRSMMVFEAMTTLEQRAQAVGEFFVASLAMLCKATGLSGPTVVMARKDLLDDGFIERCEDKSRAGYFRILKYADGTVAKASRHPENVAGLCDMSLGDFVAMMIRMMTPKTESQPSRPPRPPKPSKQSSRPPQTWPELRSSHRV